MAIRSFSKRDLLMLVLIAVAGYGLFQAFPKSGTVSLENTQDGIQKVGATSTPTTIKVATSTKPKTTTTTFQPFSLDNKVIYSNGNVTLGKPVRIIIPKIGLNTRVIGVGLTSEGAMASPKGPMDVGWFNQGPLPGQTGSAVLAGHSSWQNAIPAAFDRLKNLRVGDKIYSQDENGVIVIFVVREVRTFDREVDPSVVFESSSGKHLNLITCSGAWDYNAGTSEKRLVVFADLVE